MCFRLSSNVCVPNKLKGCLAGFQFLTLLNADSWHALLTVQHLSGFHNITTQPSSPPRLGSLWLWWAQKTWARESSGEKRMTENKNLVYILSDCSPQLVLIVFISVVCFITSSTLCLEPELTELWFDSSEKLTKCTKDTTGCCVNVSLLQTSGIVVFWWICMSWQFLSPNVHLGQLEWVMLFHQLSNHRE